jgi:hypothetical protein
LSHLLFLPRYYVGFGRFTLYLKDEHMAHFFEIVFLHHYMDITPVGKCLHVAFHGMERIFSSFP